MKKFILIILALICGVVLFSRYFTGVDTLDFDSRFSVMPLITDVFNWLSGFVEIAKSVTDFFVDFFDGIREFFAHIFEALGIETTVETASAL